MTLNSHFYGKKNKYVIAIDTKALITLLIIVISSCQSNKKTNGESIVTIDIAEAWDSDNKKNINASELFADVTYIPLDTDDTYLIGKVPNLYITDNYIFMGGFLFDKEGHFITKLGKTGQGPEEFLFARDELFNEARKEYYALDNYRNYIHVYDINNHYLRSIPVPAFRERFFLLNKDQLLIANKRGFTSREPKDWEFSYMVIGVEKGDTLYKHTSISLNELKEMTNLYATPFDVFWSYHNTMNFYDGIQDTIYSLKKGRIDQPRYAINFGKYKNFEEIKKEIPTDNCWSGTYMKISTIYEYKDYLKFYVTYNRERKIILYNKADHSTFVLGEVKKDIDGICDESSYVWPDDLDEDQIKTIATKSGKVSKEGDNPIIIIKKEK